jgi:allophanate hydrolase subunit 2
MIQVLRAGANTRIVDGIGQRRRAHLGVSIGGAADGDSLAHANSLAGNPLTAAGLEMTLLGPALGFAEPARIALSGAPFAATLNDRPLAFHEAVDVNAGDVLRLQSCATGIRAYLAVRGGLTLDIHRPLKTGDRLTSAGLPFVETTAAPPAVGDGHLRVTPGYAFPEPLLQGEYQVSPHSNRQAIFLEGSPIAAPVGDMITEGVPLGGIQLPPSGQPMILFVDQQTTGGYPIIATVIHRDIPKLGQLRPQQTVRFRYVTFEEAQSINETHRSQR